MSFEPVLWAFPRLPISALSGTAFRAVNLRHVSSPLSAVGSIRVGGRYNLKGEFEALYLSENPDTTLREVEFNSSVGGTFKAIPKDPYVIFSIAFSLARVVDISQPDALAVLGVSLEDLRAPWRKKQLFGEPVLTQAIGRTALGLGVQAIKFVSATDGRINLAVLPANLDGKSWLEISLEGKVVHRLPNL